MRVVRSTHLCIALLSLDLCGGSARDSAATTLAGARAVVVRAGGNAGRGGGGGSLRAALGIPHNAPAPPGNKHAAPATTPRSLCVVQLARGKHEGRRAAAASSSSPKNSKFKKERHLMCVCVCVMGCDG